MSAGGSSPDPDSVAEHAALAWIEGNLRSLLAQAPVGMFLSDARGACRYVNDTWRRLTGLSQEEARGEGWIKALHADDLELVVAEWQRFSKAGDDFALEYRFCTPDGRVTWVMGGAVALRDEVGEVAGYLGTVTDISARKQADEAQRSSEDKLQKLFEFSPLGIALNTLDGRYVEANPALLRITGYTLKQLNALNYWALTPPEYEAQEQLQLQALRETGRYGPYEKAYIRKDGGRVPVALNGVLIRGGDGQEYIWSTVEDISGRKQAEARLRELSSLNEAILDGADYSIIATDVDGTIRRFNSAAERMLGYRAEEVIGKLTPAVIHDPAEVARRAVELSAQLAEVIEPGFAVFVAKARRGVAEEREWTYIRKDGSRFPVLLSVTALHDDQGAITGFLGIASDITERQKVDRLKNEFISTVSHELRTPLTSIRGALGLLAGGALGAMPDKARELLDIADKNSERLTRLINDLLDIEKIASGKMRFVLQPHSLMPLIGQALESIACFGEQYGVGFRLMGAVTDARVNVDADRFLQVMSNLLSNAAKFAPAGSEVDVAVARHGAHLRISVTDRGPGIPEAFLGRMFEKFSQADATDTRQRGGSGLGLSITKAIVERLGGRIDFATAAGQGTTFHVDLPEWRAAPVTAGRSANPMTNDPPLEGT